MTVSLNNLVSTEVDATGLSCPLPVLKTRKAMKELASGEMLRVCSTDHGSVKDIESFCIQTGNDLVSTKEDAGIYEFLIRKS